MKNKPFYINGVEIIYLLICSPSLVSMELLSC